MAEPQKRLILANGESYTSQITVRRPGGPPDYPRSYDEARIHVKGEISKALDKFEALPAKKRFKDETVLCLRLHPDMTAKSYDPNVIFSLVPDLGNVGSRSYTLPTREVAQTNRIKKQLEKHVQNVTGRIVFVRGNDAGFRRLLSVLDRSERELNKEFRNEIQSIEKFDLLSPTEQLLGFDPNWKEGRVEIIIHPTRYETEAQTDFLRTLFATENVPWERTKIASYSNGPLFVSCYLTHASLNALAGANPLRNAHPLVFGGLEDLRGASSFPSPPPPPAGTRSTIKIGIFDGGIDTTHPMLAGHAEQDEGLSIQTPAQANCVAHGIAVAGVALYGALNDKDTATPLPPPPVSVVSFRALPTSNPKDIDLYESIDVIENAVAARPDIQIYNISFGPRGPFIEDSISRFTYALDLLAATRKVSFCVAVGNDGNAGEGLDRVQAPSDLVNGFGVGAYTKRGGREVHAPYSCKGPGRESAKLKPDLVAFGGCDQMPIHLISACPNQKVLHCGTSFSSPSVAAIAAEVTGRLERGNPLLTRALMIHSARHPENAPDHLLGHGIVMPSADDILRCEQQEVTVVYQGAIPLTKHKLLKILLPTGLGISGSVTLDWTIAGLPAVCPNHPFDYTSACIDDTFYPNGHRYRFTIKNSRGKTETKILHLVKDAAEVKQLTKEGWRRSGSPVSDSGNEYATEAVSRTRDFKWEPIVRRHRVKRVDSLEDPVLVLHAIPRNGAEAPLDYAAIVTLGVSKFQGDLYDAVLRQFTALQPVRLRSEAEIRVQV